MDEPTGLYGSNLNTVERRAAITRGRIPVAVYGLGKMGLPLAAVYADVTGNTIGVDIDESVVERVNAGESHVKREPGLPELVESVVEAEALRATTDSVGAAETAAVHVLMVPTLLDEDDDPDLSVLKSVVRDVAEGLSPGDLVIVESTTPPRTTQDMVQPLLVEGSGLEPGSFGVASCPERTVSGQAIADVRGTHPKIVGGVDKESTRTAAQIYDVISENEVIETSGATVAEAVKVFEGVYRDVNIALANQLATYSRAMDVDVLEAIEVANTQPFCDIHDPGPGVGGHCIPVYPYFLTNTFEGDGSLLRTARRVNDEMADHTAALLGQILEAHDLNRKGPRVLLFGMTYKANINELRNAPATRLATLLADAGATVLAVDPLIEDWETVDAVTPVSLADSYAAEADVVVLITPHDEFQKLDWEAFDAPILDGRGMIDRESTEAPVYWIGGPWP